jgi:hypothetical protein
MPAKGSRIPLPDRFWPKVAKSDGCWLWTGAYQRRAHGEYGHIQLEDLRIERAHRVSWMLHFGPIPPDMRVLHRCDNPRCVRPDHLFLGTQLDNIADMDRKGRRRTVRGDAHHARRPGARIGERNGRSRLTPDDVRRIRAMRAGGAMYKDIASAFGVATPTVQHIVSGKNWSHVE